MGDELRQPPNELMADRLEQLNTVTESTVDVEYHGGGVFALTARDNEFWNSVFTTLEEHEFRVQKVLDGTVYVEKIHTRPHEQRERWKAQRDAASERERDGSTDGR